MFYVSVSVSLLRAGGIIFCKETSHSILFSHIILVFMELLETQLSQNRFSFPVRNKSSEAKKGQDR